MKHARNWAPFRIGDDQYFVVATLVGNTCPIFRYDRISEKFTNQSDGIQCKNTFDLKPFKLNGEQYIAVANQGRGRFVVIWKWNGRRFTKFQELNNTATYVEAFDVGRDTFIAISGQFIISLMKMFYETWYFSRDFQPWKQITESLYGKAQDIFSPETENSDRVK